MLNAPALQIQMGQFTKADAGEMEVAFTEPFERIPFVFLTPTYSGSPITFVDAVVATSSASFTVSSPNCSNPSGPYTVSWLAITQGE